MTTASVCSVPSLALIVLAFAGFGGLAFLSGLIIGRLGQRREDERRAQAVARREGWIK